MAIPVLIDTDIGDNIDDALALALALQSPELELHAVTTVYGDVQTRARLAQRLLATHGKGDVPVAAGVSKPLLGPPPLHAMSQRALANDTTDLPPLHPAHAADLLIATAHSIPGQLAIIALGPLTNLALALIKEPALAQRARVVLMGGWISSLAAETNMRADPEAATIMFASGIPITVVTKDVTTRCTLTSAQELRLRTNGGDLLAALVAAWRETSTAPVTLNDPLVVTAVFRPEFLPRRAARHVSVELANRETRGRTLMSEPHAGQSSSTEVCLDVRAGPFVSLFLDRVAPQLPEA